VFSLVSDVGVSTPTGGEFMAGRLLGLQLLRGIAANLVVLQHLWEFELKYAGTQLPTVVRYGDLGVDIFFVLSGFVMVAIAGRGVGPLNFLWRRLVRIYPTYWLATAIMIALAVAVPGLVHEQLDKIPLWRSFLLIAASPEQPIVSVGWTLVHEMYFYVVFAAFIALRIPILIGVLIWTVLIVVTTAAWPDYVATSPILSMATSPLTFEFMMGLIIGLLWLQTQTPGVLLASVAGVAALLTSMIVNYRFLSHPPTLFSDSIAVRVLLFGAPIALIVYALVAYERHHLWRPQKLLVAVGDWSYSIYLFHFMVLSALGRVVLQLFGDHGRVGSIVLFVGGFLLVNLVGAALYILFERPTLEWFHRLGPATQTANAEQAHTEVVQVGS
jgi:exopolysaccharide production protein ExoZ